MLIVVSFVVDSLPTNLAAATSSGAGTSSASAWSAPNSIENNLSSVSCPSANFCVAVSLVGDAFTYNGTNWSAPKLVYYKSLLGLGAVSCASANFCVALGEENGVALTFNGTSWSAPKKIFLDGSQGVVSCPSENFCVALETTNGDVLTYNGTSWSAPKAIFPDGSQGYVSLSCPLTNDCVALGVSGAGGFGVTYDGTSWLAPEEIFPSGGDGATVSCPSANFCVATTEEGDSSLWVASSYDGTSWSTPTLISDKHPALNLQSISCASANFCVAVGAGVITYNGTSWSTPTYYANDGWASVSCPSANFCAAVGGGVITYHGATCTPTISSVSKIESGYEQPVTITGPCLGSLKPFSDSETPYLRVVDGLGGLDGASGWSACSHAYHSQNNVRCGISSWTSTKIVLDALSSADSSSCTGSSGTATCSTSLFNLGDSLLFQVWNPTSGSGPGLKRTTVAPDSAYTQSKTYLAGVAWADEINHYTNGDHNWFLAPSCMTDSRSNSGCYNATAMKYLAQLKAGEANTAFDLGALSVIDDFGVIGMQEYLSYFDARFPNSAGPEVAELIVRGFSTGAAPAWIGQKLYTLMAGEGGGGSFGDAWLMSALTEHPDAADFFVASLQPGEIEQWSSTDQGLSSGIPTLDGTPLCTYRGNASQCFEAVALSVAYSSLMGYADYPEYAGPLKIAQLGSVMFAAERDFSGEMTATNFIAPWFIQFGGTPDGANAVSVVNWVAPLVNINGAVAAPTGAYIYNAQHWLSIGWTIAGVLLQVAGTLLLGPALDVMVDVVGDSVAAATVGATFASAFEDSGTFWEAWETATEAGESATSLLKLSYQIYAKTSDILTAKGDYENLVTSGTTAQQNEAIYFLGQMVTTFHEATAALINNGMLLNSSGHVVPKEESIAEGNNIVANPLQYSIKGGVPLYLVWVTAWAQFTAATR
jgi:hypothetical protein